MSLLLAACTSQEPEPERKSSPRARRRRSPSLRREPTCHRVVTPFPSKKAPTKPPPAPTPVTFAGYDGLYRELRLPRALYTDNCSSGAYEVWNAVDPETYAEQRRYQYGAGSVDRIWILDANGHRLVVNATRDPAITRKDAATLDAMLESITIHTDDAAQND